MEDIPENLKDLMNMRDRDLRSRGLFVAEGRLLVARAVAASFDVLAIVADGAAGEEARALAGSSIPLSVLDQDSLDAVAGFQFHRGMLAFVSRPAFPAASSSDIPEGPVLVLPEITDPGNLGTLLRSALAFGFTTVYLGRRSCDPWNRKCLRASMGAAFALRLREAESVDLGRLAERGFAVLAAALETGAITSGEPLPYGQGRVALVLGNEYSGIPAEWRTACDRAIQIPVSGAVDSLNVAVAGSILMRDLCRPGLH